VSVSAWDGHWICLSFLETQEAERYLLNTQILLLFLAISDWRLSLCHVKGLS
jgi:hypothetical protein